MTALSLQKSFNRSELPATWRRMWHTSPFLAVSTIIFAIAMIGSAIVATLNPTMLNGIRMWIKPLKFSTSVTFYCLTLLWILSMTTRWPRWTKLIAFIIGANLWFDLGWVILQAVRGVQSHFNFTTTFDGALYSAVGTSINIVMFMNIAAIILLLAERIEDKPFQWALIFGLITTTVGGFSAIAMTIPSATQMAAMQSGESIEYIGAHSVGVEDGGPGLPFLGWSTEGGDLRIAHFVGLHGLQIIPLFGLWINRRYRDRLPAIRRSTLIAIAGLTYIGMTLLFLWQALRGQSIIAPDALTLAAFGSLLGAATIASLVALRPNQPQPTTI